MKTFLAVVGGIVVFPAWVAGWAILNAFVLTKLWWWFVMPSFHLPQLSIPLAYGLILTVTFLTRNFYPIEDSDAKPSTGTMLAKAFATSITVSGSSLGLGWIVHLFV